MRKLLLSALVMFLFAFMTNASTYMMVETKDNAVDYYDVENITLVDYESDEETITPYTVTCDTTGSYFQGVTVNGKQGYYTYVDLGLSSGVMWATYNVGTSMPTGYGDYFAWGETTPKSIYDYNNYKWFDEDYSLKKYGSRYGRTTLEACDDAATVNWGGRWRMPTLTEIEELIDGCNWKWISNYKFTGVAGRLGTSKANGNTIFLPATGYAYSDSRYHGSDAYYWGSTVDDSQSAYTLFYHSSLIKYASKKCYIGLTIRAVFKM